MVEKVGFSRRMYRKLIYRDLDKRYAEAFSVKQTESNGSRALDVGCGFGFGLIEKLKAGYDVYGIDIDEARIKKLQEMFDSNGAKAVLQAGNAEKLPFESNFFDEVHSRHVIEHIENDLACLKEMFRVLKPNGKLNLIVPNEKNLFTQFRKGLRLKNCYTDRTHLREYTKEAIADLLQKAGFKEFSLTPQRFFPPIGLKVYFLMEHFMPIDKIFNPFARIFPQHAAELQIISVKKK